MQVEISFTKGGRAVRIDAKSINFESFASITKLLAQLSAKPVGKNNQKEILQEIDAGSIRLAEAAGFLNRL